MFMSAVILQWKSLFSKCLTLESKKGTFINPNVLFIFSSLQQPLQHGLIGNEGADLWFTQMHKKRKNMHQVNNELADLCFLLWNRVFLTASGAYLWQYIPLSGLWMFPQYWYYKARYSHTLSYFFNIYLYLIKRGMKSTLRCLQFALFATKGNKTLVTVIDRLDFKAFLNPLQQEFSRFSCAKSFRATKCTFLTSVSYVSTQRLGGYIYNDSSWTGLQVF